MVPSRSGHSRSIEGQNERPSEREIDSGEQDFHTFRGTAANQIEEIRLSAWTSLSGSLSLDGCGISRSVSRGLSYFPASNHMNTMKEARVGTRETRKQTSNTAVQD